MQRRFKNHIILCLLADQNSPQIGLVHFIMPLRSVNIALSELKVKSNEQLNEHSQQIQNAACLQDVVIVGDAKYVEREWPLLQNFPQVFALDGNIQERANMRAVNVTRCAMCIVASADAAGGRDAAAVARSSELVLCTINIQSMPRSARFATLMALAQPATLPRATIDRLGNSVHILTEIGAPANYSFGTFPPVGAEYAAVFFCAQTQAKSGAPRSSSGGAHSRN